MKDTKLEISRRNLPHWTLEGSIYYITFCTMATRLEPNERQIVLDPIRLGHAKFYQLIAVVVMPGYVHLLLRPQGEYSYELTFVLSYELTQTDELTSFCAT